jgi:hypothetical protein
MIALTTLLSLLFALQTRPVPFDHTGFARTLALVGDLDGDQCSEIAVGSPSDGPERCGRVYVFSGQSGALLRTFDGPGPGSGHGLALDAVGDLDGDGIPDLAIGAPYQKATKRSSKAEGVVRLVSGKDGRVLLTLAPAPDERYFGTDLVSLGDLDGDGKPELLVRARVGAGEKEHERFIVVSTVHPSRLYAIDSPDGVTSHDLANPLARLDDVDGDGLPDFAVQHGGDVHVHSGKDGKPLATLASPLAPDQKSAFGFSLCGVPGKPVLLAVGDTREETWGSIRLLPVVLGKGDEQRAAAEKACFLLGEEELPGVGCSLALAGDLNGDGSPDLVAGLCDGRKGGLMVLSTDGLVVTRAMEGEEPEDGRLPLGWRVAAGRDVDGDGTPDIAVSRYWPPALDAAARGVAVFSGRDGRKIREISPPAESPPPAPKPPAGK